MPNKTEKLLSLLNGQPVIPVLKIAYVADAVPLARALARGGLPMIEVTLRTRDALEAIRRIGQEVEDAVVGAGTILNPRQFEQAAQAGSRFIVSPGATRQLFEAARDSEVPAGGAAFLKSLASPFAGIRFCPTGGVTAGNARDYLGLPNVICVGGSWVAPDDMVKAGQWDAIERLAREASTLSG
jgi:2-dehydro-3-deoxyphosphogluconate aldolase/(4S)-4-hydroxy-2-oxoglutarate aldolase